jgi:hypothetical protein
MEDQEAEMVWYRRFRGPEWYLMLKELKMSTHCIRYALDEPWQRVIGLDWKRYFFDKRGGGIEMHCVGDELVCCQCGGGFDWTEQELAEAEAEWQAELTKAQKYILDKRGSAAAATSSE